MYVTLTAFDNMHGSKPLKIKGIIKLVKEPENKYDTEAIACEMRHFGKIGYLANSTNTVIKGCMSAGRLYDKIGDVYFARIEFVHGSNAIAKILTAEEYLEELKNPESDLHYLCENENEIDLDIIKEHF